MALPGLDSVQGQPVRTITNGDVVSGICDGTTKSQLLGIDSAGRITIKLDDGTGNAITSQVSGTQRALDVGINVAGIQIDPRQAGVFNTTLPTLTTGAYAAPSLDSSGRMMVVSPTAANFLATVSQGTSPWVSSDLADGPVAPGTAASKSMLGGLVYTSAGVVLTTGQQSALQGDAAGNLRVNLVTSIPAGANNIGSVNQGTSPWITSDLADGSVAPGTAGTKSLLAGMVYTSAGVVMTNGQQAALQSDAAGNLRVNLETPIPAGTNNIGSVNQGTSPWITSDQADGPVAPGTAATKSMLGGGVFNSTPPVLTTGQQAALQLDAGGNLKVTVSSTTPGNPVNSYFTSVSAVAYGSSDTHLYTITSSKTFNGKKFFAAAPGRIRIDVQLSTNGTTFNTVFTAYNSTATPNITIDMDEFYVPDAGAGAAVQIVRYNEEPGSSFGISSTISGTEN